ncbi:hypothetical protein YPPY14_2082, partial [Yersinia pestis PY-14]
MWNVHGWG